MSANNVFVSYKYHDSDVKPLKNNTIVRDYVDYLENMFNKSKKVYYRGEKDGNDLSDLNEETIRKYLADKIFYTSITIVLMSPNMYDRYLSENEQWIPWEISYSLKENRRESGKSHMNAILAVVLPDCNGKYDYAIEQHDCHRTIRTNEFFPIIRKNMFNIKKPDTGDCKCGCQVYHGTCSYIPIVRWDDFIDNYDKYIQEALDNKEDCESFNIIKQLEQGVQRYV